MASQIVAITMSNPYGDCDVGDNKIDIDMTTATGGTVTAAICSTYNAQTVQAMPFQVNPVKLKGFIRKIVTDPGATAPTDQYDITLTDEDGYDVAGGSLANRATATTEAVVPSAPIYVDSELTVNISAAGDEKTIELKIFMTKEG
jgi:hypothetical protein